MSLRARLVLALLVLFGAGMAVYGVASYRAFERSELQRLDEQIHAALPVAEQELRLRVDGFDLGRGPAGWRFHGRSAVPQVVVPPGTYAELRTPDGTALRPAIQVADASRQPDLSTAADPRPGTITMSTVPSVDGDVSWRVAAGTLDDGRTLLVAMPMTSVGQALDRLLTIELVAGGLLLLVLGVGAWAVLRSGLRPLERMAATARSITSGSLEQRVPTPSADTEVKQLATALNTMLDDLEGAFREREATEARLRRFLSDASHELRTPLTSIQGYAELFRLGSEGEQADLEVIMRRIEAESGRMRELVENLLALARLDEDHVPVREPADLAVVAADACSDAAATDPDRPIHLDAPDPAPIEGDPGHLRQAVGNLVANALRHTPPGTAVEVVVHAHGDRAQLQVRDHGDGLSPEALEHAFDRFWQADPSREGAGAGLGLSIVQAVADEHGGVAAAANAPDGGAVFTLELPLSSDDPHAATSASAGDVDAAGSEEPDGPPAPQAPPPPPRPPRTDATTDEATRVR